MQARVNVLQEVMLSIPTALFIVSVGFIAGSAMGSWMYGFVSSAAVLAFGLWQYSDGLKRGAEIASAVFTAELKKQLGIKEN